MYITKNILITYYASFSLFVLITGLQASRELKKRQARDERGKLIDLNKEPSPEPTSVDIRDKSKSTPPEPNHEVVSSFPSKKGKSFKTRLPVILPVSLD